MHDPRFPVDILVQVPISAMLIRDSIESGVLRVTRENLGVLCKLLYLFMRYGFIRRFRAAHGGAGSTPSVPEYD